MRRRGAWLTTVIRLGPTVMAIFALMLIPLAVASNQYLSNGTWVPPVMGTNTIQENIEGGVELRSTANSPAYLLSYRVGGTPLKEQIQQFLYCQATENPPDNCLSRTVFTNRVETAADAVIPGRYGLEIRYKDTTYVDIGTFNLQSSDKFLVPIAMPGGTTARFKLHIELQAGLTGRALQWEP